MGRPLVLFVAPAAASFPGGGLAEIEFEVVGPVAAEATAARLATDPPDAVLIDVDGDPGSYDVLLQLHEAQRPCRAVLVGTDLPEDVVREAFHVGVYACLRKPASASVVRGALHRAAEGTAVMRECLDAAARRAPQSAAGEQVDTSALTPREQEILRLLLEGRTTPAMAETLSVSPRTIKFHVSNLLRKLGFSSRLALLAKLRREDTMAPFRAQ